MKADTPKPPQAAQPEAEREAEFDRLMRDYAQAATRIDGPAMRAAYIALHAFTVPRKWMAIETAPKDCILLLGYAPHPRTEGTRRVYEGRWNEEHATWTSLNGFLNHTNATHWTPMPPPPSDSQKEHP